MKIEAPLKVLCVVDYYLPGFRGGGVIRSVANMCGTLSPEIKFWIFTRNHDLASSLIYPDIESNAWNGAGLNVVYYADKRRFGYNGLIRSVCGIEFDLLYLNSFFSFFGSISILLRRSTGVLQDVPVLLAPRGEFSSGALELKSVKKRVFIAIAKILGLYRDVYWHASTEHEASDILRVFPGAVGKVIIAADPVTVGDMSCSDVGENVLVDEDGLKLVFISRISPKKNLDGLLHFLCKVKGRVKLSVYGPIEDFLYWDKCLAIVRVFPVNVKFVYCGILPSHEVSRAFSKFDLFAFPTLGENFGHVIFESLRAGTPVLISDQTPWQTQPHGEVTVLPIQAADAWVAEIEAAINRSEMDNILIRKAAVEYAQRYAIESNSRDASLQMLHKVVAQLAS